MLCLGQVYRRVPEIKSFIIREVHKSYYDALGLTPKASQGDIKKAYYKMSMVYHPDKGADNSVKFQEISTAYEVLGNNKLRKLYDKGLLPTGAVAYTQAQQDQTPPTTSQTSAPGANNSQYERRQDNFYDNVNASHFEEGTRAKGPYKGKSEHYDYDAWTQAHYSETFSRQEYGRAEKFKRKEDHIARLKRQDLIFTSVFVVTVALVIYGGTVIHHQDFQRKSK